MSSPKKTLIIAYAFPPITGGGVQRWTKFTKYLNGLGWTPIVLTKKASSLQLTDEKMMEEVDGIKVCRVDPVYSPVPSPNPIKKAINFFFKIMRTFFTSDVEWLLPAIEAGEKVIKEEKIDIIVATGNPFGSFIVAMILSKKTGLPFIVDYRDSWSFSEYDWGNGPVVRFFARRWESKVLKACSHAIVVKPKMISELESLVPSVKDKLTLITNGHDPADFPNPVLQKNNEKFTITFTGMMWRQAGHHSPVTFFQALKEILEESPDKRAKIKVEFIGGIEPYYQQMVSKYHLNDVVEIHEYMPHHKVVAKQQNSDLLLLLIENENGHEASLHYSGIIPGKLFEYNASGAPILAIVPNDGYEADLIKKSGTGLVAEPNNVADVKDKLLQFLNGQFSYHQKYEMIEGHSREALTHSLVKVLEHSIPEARS